MRIRIIVLDEGRLIEMGSHSELLAAGGFYAELEESQRNKLQAADQLGAKRWQDDRG